MQENLIVLETQIADQQAELNEIQSEQANFPELENQLDELNIQLGLDQETVRFLKSQQYQGEITAAGASAYVAVVDSADSVSPVTTGGRTNLFLGALLGLILGVGAVFFLEYLDRTVRTSADVETLLSIPVLGIIPRLRKLMPDSEEDDGRGALPLMMALDPLDPAAEAYRNLRMNLMFMSTDEEPIRTLLFSSPGPNEGKSTTSINFAVMLAQQGQRVLLIDADLRRPALHRAMDVLREPGLLRWVPQAAVDQVPVAPPEPAPRRKRSGKRRRKRAFS